MTKDEEYVCSVWERAESFPHGYSDNDLKWRISLGGEMFTKASVPDPLARTEAEAWSAAAEFTREHEEKVRQLSEEIHRLQCLLMPSPETHVREATDEAWPEGAVCEYVRETFAYARTIARLEAELTRLTAGMKPEAL